MIEPARVTVAYLADHREFIPQLAPLLHAEWGYLHPGATLADRVALLDESCRRDELPIALVAHVAGELLGTAALSPGLRERPDLTPWLAGVYVLAAHRGRGIGSVLVRAIEAEAWRLGFARLYLVTAGKEPFYEALGWRAVEQQFEHGEHVTVMRRDLCEAAAGPAS